MLRKPLLGLLLALLLGGTFAYGIVSLFILRYEVGDVYPPYSSLRADPLGTKALAAALGELPNVDVSRNFKPLPKLRTDVPVTLIYTGVPHTAMWTSRELLAFDQLVVGGSRAIFTFQPVETPPTEKEEKREDQKERTRKKKKLEAEKSEAEKKKTGDKPKEKKDDAEEENANEASFISFGEVAKRWGFGFDFLPAEKTPYERHAALIEPGGRLESDLTWHSALCFRDLKPHWKVLYMCGTKPVIIERQYGHGSIVLVADSYLVSNEALRKERHPQLLARLFAGPPKIIFDEESRGLRDNPGIASLARKYRLHGVVAGLVLLAVLFIWKNSVRFIPAYESSLAESDVVVGKESREGFINLLRRSIRPAAIFETCVVEWRKSSTHRPHDLACVEEIAAQELARPARERNPIAAYRAVRHALARKR